MQRDKKQSYSDRNSTNSKENSYTFKEPKDLIFGIRAVIEAIRSGREINKIIIQKGMHKDLFFELKEEIAGKNFNLQFVPIEKLNKLTQQNHQGVVAFISPIEYQKIEDLVDSFLEKDMKPCVLFLDRLTDVRNFGAIARTAECLGVDAIVIPSRGSVSVTADAIKTSAGALHKIPVCKSDNLKDSLFYLQQSGLRIVAATEKTSVPLYEVNLRGPVAIIMGSEEDGVSNDILKMADIKAKIPMRGTISSMNVGVSAGIILYERIRQISH